MLEPLWWMLFGAGGFAAALVLPALLFGITLAFPLGWFGDDLSTFQRMRVLFGNPVGQGLLIAVFSLTFWHSAHHLRHFALDLGLGGQGTAVSFLLYGGALVATLATVGIVGSLS